MDGKPPPVMCTHPNVPGQTICPQCMEEQAWLKDQELKKADIARRMGEPVERDSVSRMAAKIATSPDYMRKKEQLAIDMQRDLLGPTITTPGSFVDEYKAKTGELKVECNEFLFKYLPGSTTIQRHDALAFHLLTVIENEWKIHGTRIDRETAEKREAAKAP